MEPGNSYRNTYGPFLPRPSRDFTEGAFAPFSPILPVPIDMPAPGEALPDPRRTQVQVGWNLPTGQPRGEGITLASFGTLQTLADLYSVARACIQLRKAEIRGLDWDVVLTKDAEKKYKGNTAAMRDFGARRDEARKFFRRPDPDYWSFESWLDDMLEQVFVFDALTLFLQPVRGKGMGKGLLGSDIDCLQLVDGQTIRPLYDVHGASPRPPAPAWQQYLFGVPRSDFTDVLNGRDLERSGMTEAQAQPFSRDQMLYLPMVRRRWTPYGFPPVERALIPIMSGLQKQGYQLDFYREGTVPAVYVAPGDVAMTPNQIRELQDALNAIAGDPAWHHKVIVLPPGSKTMPQKDATLADDFDNIVMTQVCMAFDVRPLEIGISPQVSTLSSPFAAREAAQASRTMTERTSTRPLLKFLSSIFDGILQDICGFHDMRFNFSGQDEVQDQAAMTDLLVKQTQSGLRSIDESRDELGLTPWGLPETSEPVVFTPMGPIPLDQAAHLAAIQAGLPPSGSKPSSSSSPSTGAHTAARAAITAPGRTGQPGSVAQRQASRGGALAPQHATGTGAPGTATGKPVPKAALAELDALGRHLRKGRDITTWEPVWLPESVLTVMKADLGDGHTVTTAVEDALRELSVMLGKAGRPKARRGTTRTGPRNQQQQQQNPPPQQTPQSLNQQFAQLGAQYATQIQAAFTAVMGQAAALIAQWVAGTLAVTLAGLIGLIVAALTKSLGKVLRRVWRQAWALGRHAAEEAAQGKGNAARDSEALAAFLATFGTDLAGLISKTRMRQLEDALRDAVRAGEDPQVIAQRIEDILRVASRAAMIADTEVTRAANAAALQVFKDLGIAYKTWQSRRDGKVCPVCLANQDQGPIPLSALFANGLAAPPAHPRCRCWTSPWTPPSVLTGKVLTRRVTDTGQVVYTDEDAPDANPAGGGALTGPYPHRAAADYIPGATAGTEPPRWDGTDVEPHLLSLPSGDDGAWGNAAGLGSRPGVAFPAPYMDGYWPGGGHGSGQPPASPIGAENGRPPNPVGKTANAAEVLRDAPKAAASRVSAQLSRNYPAESIAWVRRCEWVGPVELPLSTVDFGNWEDWAAAHQGGHVDEFAADLKAGREVDPAVAIMRPGHPGHVRLIDGHHRSLACRKIGWPVRAYVGFPTGKADIKAAFEAHLHQENQGSSEENKSFTAGAIGAPGNVSGLTPFNLAGQGKRPKESVGYRKAGDLSRSCGECSMFIAGGACTSVEGPIEPADTCDIWTPRTAKAAKAPYVAGLMVRAADTGRVLMLQRALDDDQGHAAGKLEPPGGHIEAGESLLDAAKREFQEETYMRLPPCSLTGSWTSVDGIYRGFVVEIPSEDTLDLENGRDQFTNPDGDSFESCLWADPQDFPGNPMLRPEMTRDWQQVQEALNGAMKSARTPMLSTTHNPLGPHSLWHTPDRHTSERQSLPDYVEGVAHALERAGHPESESVALAIAAIKEWAAGHAFGGRVKVTPTVQAAARAALAEWSRLKETHH
jgi:SPP1 gp7 family putative phage head morphogenesis protein